MFGLVLKLGGKEVDRMCIDFFVYGVVYDFYVYFYDIVYEVGGKVDGVGKLWDGWCVLGFVCVKDFCV